MQSESGSRFNQSYYQPPPYDSKIPQVPQTGFSPYTPIQQLSPTYGATSPLSPSTIQSNMSPSATPVYIVPATHQQPTIQRKMYYLQQQIEQNERKYHIKKDSMIYQFHSQLLKIIMHKFQKEFPSNLVQQIKRNEKQFENGPHKMYRSLFFGTAIYWIALRRSNWFKLTNNVALKFAGLFYCEHKMWSLQIGHRDFFLKKVFENHKSWEDLIDKYGINTENALRLKQIS